MKLTPEQTSELVGKLEHLLSHDCTHCKTREWLVNERIFDLKEFSGPDFPSSDNTAVFPVAVVTCKSCKSVHFFSAVLLGLLEKK